MEKNKKAIRDRFEGGRSTYDRAAVAQRMIAENLSRMIRHHLPPPKRLLEIGCGTGFLSRRLAAWADGGDYFLNDLNEHSEKSVAALPLTYRAFIPGDAEICSFPGNLDAIVSASTFQWFRDLPRFIERAACLLNPGGGLAFSTFGRANFQEIRSLWGNGLNYHSPDDHRGWLQDADFELCETFEEVFPVFFETPLDVLRHLRETGVNGNFNSSRNPQHLLSLVKEYRSRFSTVQGVRLTFHAIYLVARRK